jgi:DNA polymerase lambda
MTTRHMLVCYHHVLRLSLTTIFLGIVPHLLHALREAGIITEDLALPDDSHATEAIYRGLCKLPDTVDEEGKLVRRLRRRIDILSIPWKNRGAALLYYTVRPSNVDFWQALTLSDAGWWYRTHFAAASASTFFHMAAMQFNRAMRFKANKMGYSLNQRGLFQGVVRDPHDRRIKTNTGESLIASFGSIQITILNH